MNTDLNPRDLRNHLQSHIAMESTRFRKSAETSEDQHQYQHQHQYQYQRPFTHSLSTAKKQLSPSYFSVESMIVLIGLTASLLILPLVLPPLPPPPSMLLLLPIGILGLLLFIAFMPGKVRDLKCRSKGE